VGVKGGASVGAQAGPVGAQAQTGIDAQARTDVIRDTATTARDAGDQVGTAVRGAARTGAQATEKASATAVDKVQANANANANSTLGTGEEPTDTPEPEEDDE
ncbi:MAG: hypothetical protein NDI66_06960, partial [Pseudomonas sp.]|nr:hypothetical protein [Pseudomonas sp.]